MSDAPGIRVLHLYDAYLNIYADRGNIAVLQRRCAWRGLTCQVDGLAIDGSFTPGDYDLLYVGGGQDRDQQMIAERMAGEVGAAIRASADQDTVVLAVCGGYQLLGDHYLDTTGVRQPGVGLFDLHTIAGETRMIGNVAIEAPLPAVHGRPAATVGIVGFENHAGRTHLGPGAEPLGRVLNGQGNNGHSGFEGCRKGRALGTYLHGPLLPRNPELADWLIAAALEHRYADAAPELTPIEDRFERRARVVALQRAAADQG